MDYRKLCIEIFGTDNVEELKRIALKNKTGRKRAISDTEVDKIVKMQQQGKTIEEIARFFGVSRQTVSKRLNEFPKGDYAMRLNYMFRQKVCTEIYVDFLNKNINVINRTDDKLLRAFGAIDEPTWEDFEQFLSERCFPKERENKKDLLDVLDIDAFDPLQIIEKTKGRMAEDNQYIRLYLCDRC